MDLRCELCTSVFATKQERASHTIQVHNGFPVYPCAQCELTFGTIDHLEKHIQVKHSNVQVKYSKHVNVFQVSLSCL